MNFLVDMPLSPVLARWLSDKGHDAVHAMAIGMARAPDIAIMERARDETRTIITADLDYPRLLALNASAEPSVVLFRGGNWSDHDVLAHMELLLHKFDESDFNRSIFVVEWNRVRRRRLPIGL